MGNIKEINQRCECSTSSGIACGPVSITVINAEMKVSIGEDIRYLIVNWVQECGEDVSFEITKESIWNYMRAECDEEGWEENLFRIRKEAESENIPDAKEIYSTQYKELVALVKNKIIEEGFLTKEELDTYDF